MIVFYRFSDFINRKNIKIKDIIRDTGISSATLSNMRKNKSVTIDTIDKLCKYLKCKPEDLLEFSDSDSLK